MKKKNQKRKIAIGLLRAFLICLCILLIVAGIAFYRGLTIRTYRISSEKLTNAEPIRLVVLADLHSYPYGGTQQPLLAKINAQNPDAILMVGDMGDDHEPIRGLVMLLEGIRGIAPSFYVSGNHEAWGNYDEIIRVIRGYGVSVLKGQRETIELKGQTIQILGIDDPEYTPDQGYDEIFRPILGFDPNYYTILMAHRPEPFLTYSHYGFDLVLSGHTHGGQVRIPFFSNGLYAPNQGWNPPYVGGYYQHENTEMIVSRGLSYNPTLPRVFNPPEIVVVELTGK